MRYTQVMSLLVGQIYSGALARHCLPPDGAAWWMSPISYEVHIESIGPRWLTFRSFRVHPDGTREAIQAPGQSRNVRLLDFEKDVAEGLLTLCAPR